MALRFSIFLAILFHAASAVKLHISGNLECCKPQFKYLVAVKEFDWILGNDRLYTSPYYDAFCPHIYSADIVVEGADELENDKYEIFVSFWHTCTDDGKWMYLESRIGYVKNWIEEVYLHHNVNLTNAHGKLTWRDWEDWSTSNGFHVHF